MVKASAEARIEFADAQSGSIIVNLTAKCKQEVTVNVTKKLRTLSLRKLFFPVKGRKKEKDLSLAPQDDTKRYLEDDFSCEKVLETDWVKLTSLPVDIDRNEWLATHTLSFFDHINMIYGSVSEFCTATGCTSMTGPGNTQYLWLDERGKKCKCAAPQYVEYVMAFAKKTIHDENVFPTKYGNVFPASYDATVKKIHKLLFHVISHLYQAHYKEILVLSLHPHLNTLFEHFVTFSRQFSLVEERETELLEDLYQKLRAGVSVQKTDLAEAGESPAGDDGDPESRDNMCCGGQDTDNSVPNCGGDDRLSGSRSPAVRPTSLHCGREYQNASHRNHSANGNPGCRHGSGSHDDNKENVLHDSNQSQPALSPMATPMST